MGVSKLPNGTYLYRLPSPHRAMFQYQTGTRGVSKVPSVSLRLSKYRVMQMGPWLLQ